MQQFRSGAHTHTHSQPHTDLYINSYGCECVCCLFCRFMVTWQKCLPLACGMQQPGTPDSEIIEIGWCNRLVSCVNLCGNCFFTLPHATARAAARESSYLSISLTRATAALLLRPVHKYAILTSTALPVHIASSYLLIREMFLYGNAN